MDIDSLWDFNDPAASEARFREAMAVSADRAEGCELRTQLARALGLQRRFDEAHEVLDGLVDQLAGNPRLKVRYLLERGRACNSGGDPAQALPLFQEAWTVARAAGEDALAVDAAHMVAIVVPTDRQMEWNERAYALAAASPDPKARRWRASLANNMGWTLHDQQRFEEALVRFDEALEACRDLGNPGRVTIARWCRARCLRSLGRLEEALAEQTELSAEGTDGFACEEMAECLLALDRRQEAKPWFARAEELLLPVLGDDPAQAARLDRLRELGSP